MSFVAPTADQLLALSVNAGIDALAENPQFAAATPDVVAAIVEGIGAFAAGEWAPLNRVGDRTPAMALVHIFAAMMGRRPYALATVVALRKRIRTE